MLFTDIEGSTRHLRALGREYARVLSDQRRILRGAIAAHRGHEMGTEGDSFFVVFGSPIDGLAAAVDAQRGLAANPWPRGSSIRVRMGLHVGDLTRHEEGYVGLELNRAARIASTANGGQVVVSQAFREAVVDEIRATGADTTFIDAGVHRLKDLPGPEHLFRLSIAGLPRIDTPLKSLGAPSNLPAARAVLIGRGRELDDITTLLDGGARLVTLTGPGGVGKTSLALEVGARSDARFHGGVYFVALEDARTVEEAWTTLAVVLAVSGGDVVDDVVAALLGPPCLLLLDNLEQLEGAASIVATLRDRTTATVIATSRGPVQLRGEHVYAVSPLAIGGADSPAVELFIREATRVRPAFATDISMPQLAAVEDICRRIDGLPLAVELVASRVRHLPLDTIATALETRLDVASRDHDRPDRHRTLTATVAWSYELLDARLAHTFVGLGVFSGGCTLDAAAEVLGAVADDDGDAFDLLERLEAIADLSLIIFSDDTAGAPRVSMLKVVRGYALDKLRERGGEDSLRRAHARHFAAFAEEAEARLHGPDQLLWSDRLAAEHENLRDAFEWSAAPEREGHQERELAVRIAASLGWFWYTHGRATEGRRWLERVTTGSPTADARLQARAWQALGVLQQQQAENAAAAASFDQALGMSRAAGDEAGVGRALNSLGVTHWAEGRIDLARTHLADAVVVARAAGDDHRIAGALSNLGIVLLTAGEVEAAIASLQEALVHDRRLGDTWGIAVDQTNLGAALVRKGDLNEGRALILDMLATLVELDDPDLLASAIEACAIAAALDGDARLAVELVGGADALRAAASVPRAPADDAYLERELGPARAALGRAAADDAVSAGRARSLQSLVNLVRGSS